MPHHHTHTPHRQPAVHDSTFFFVGPFDDETTFFRGLQLANHNKPTNMSLVTTNLVSKNSSLTASPISEHSDDDVFFDSSEEEEEEDYAVLGDDDAPSRDELPPSPRRRHSGAMSISEEDLPFCYDREALRRDTAAHRAQHAQHQLPQSVRARGRAGTFAAHEAWDAETDGPSMALWVPDGRAGGECKRRRVEKARTMPSVPSGGAQEKRREALQQQHHSSEMEGPMMALWGI